MTKKKYLRLLAVLTAPLLILGVIASFTFMKHDYYVNILCNQFAGIENCRIVGRPEENLYKWVKSRHTSWFSVEWRPYESRPISYVFAEATSRIVPDVIVTGFQPYVGSGPEAEGIRQVLMGNNDVVLALGDEPEARSLVSRDGALLYCHTLEIHRERGQYGAHCFGDGWQGVVEFRERFDESSVLGPFRQSIQIEKDRGVETAITHYVVVWPLFLMIFLIGSLLWWVVSIAVKYVRAG